MTNTRRLTEEPHKQTLKWLYTGYSGQQLPPLAPRPAKYVRGFSYRHICGNERLTRWIRIIDPKERRLNGFEVKTIYWYSKQYSLDLACLIALKYRLLERYPRGLDQQTDLDRFC